MSDQIYLYKISYSKGTPTALSHEMTKAKKASQQTVHLQERTAWLCVSAGHFERTKKVLAVTGGFHSLGIYRLLSGGKIKKERLHKHSAKDEGCFPMAYSYEAADALS